MEETWLELPAEEEAGEVEGAEEDEPLVDDDEDDDSITGEIEDKLSGTVNTDTELESAPPYAGGAGPEEDGAALDEAPVTGATGAELLKSRDIEADGAEELLDAMLLIFDGAVALTGGELVALALAVTADCKVEVIVNSVVHELVVVWSPEVMTELVG